MSLWDNTPVTYTSFTPLASESQASNTLLSRLFKRGKDDSDQSSDAGSKPSSREVSVERNGSKQGSEERQSKLLEKTESAEQSNGSPSRVIKREKSGDSQSGGGNSDEQSDPSTSKSSEVDQLELTDITRRTFSSVITRLSTILERRASTPQVYRDSDFKQYWMPDSSCKECYDCGDKFTTFRRRHHCRICGQIFCNACCNQELSGKIIGYKGSIRVCIYCYQIVQNYAQKASPSGDPKVTKESLDKCLESAQLLSPEQAVNKQSHLSPQSSLNLRSPGDSDTNLVLAAAPFDLTPQSEFVADNFTSERRLLIQDSMQLRNLWSLMIDTENGVEFQSYRFRLRTYPKCIAGNKLVDWLIKQDKVANRIQAVAIGQALVDADYLDPVLNVTTPFRDDFTLYKPTDITVLDTTLPMMENLEDSVGEDSAPQWFQEIQANTQDAGHKEESPCISELGTSNSYSDLSHDSLGKIKVDDGHFDDQSPRTNIPEDVTEPIFGVPDVLKSTDDQSTSASWRTLSIATDNAEEKTTFDKIQLDHHEHLTILTKQLLSEEGLTAAWVDIIISTVDRVSLFVKPDVRFSSDDMDIRRYVHIKKVPGDKRGQTGLVHGVIFNKNIAHKKMVDTIQNPGVLLLEGTIEYQRVENKMSSLQPQILQEEEFLRKMVAKIAALKPKPDVLVVEKSVSRLAQDYLLKHGITLIYNVKRSVMERLSRFLQTEIATSVDSMMRGQTIRQTLGFCHTFSVRSFKLPSGDTKNMICFDGCATHLGCAIILRGGSLQELKRVKKIMNFMIYASYHSRLETSFCMDEFLKPTTLADSLMDFDIEAKPENGDISKDKSAEKDVKVVIDKGEQAADEKLNKNSENQKVNFYISTEEESGFEGQESSEKDHKCVLSSKDGDVNRLEQPVVVVGDIKEKLNVKKVASLSGRKTKQPGKSGTVKEDRISSFISCDTIEENDLESDHDLHDDNKGQGHTNIQSDSRSNPVDQSNLVCDNQSNTPNQSELKEPCESIVSETNIKGADNKTVVTDTHSTVDNTAENSSKPAPNDINSNIRQNTLHPETNSASTDTSPVLLRKQPDPRRMSEITLTHMTKITKEHFQRRNSEVIQLTDHSDPLHNYQISQDDSIFQSSLALQEQYHSHRFRLKKCLENVVLSVSPYVKYDLPYLETEVGSKCELRPYFPEEIYWSSHFGYKNGQSKPRFRYQDDGTKKYEPPSNIKITEAHEFIRCQLNKSIWDRDTQYLLAKYRAYGGRINVASTKSSRTKHDLRNQSSQGGNQSVKGRPSSADLKGDNSQKESSTMWEKKVDSLDPFRHQRLAVLFSSFSYESENHPNPCVYPWTVTMDYYGKNDITLGGFLERFCFRQSYVCPSDSCNTPMEKHIRRFVHGQGCISVVLKKVSKPLKDGQTNILLWSWCHKCKQVTPVVQLSSESWHMSFAKYLEFRFHGNIYKCRTSMDPCTHSLHHDHFQYFGFNDVVASFKYSTIKLKEIKLPPFVISKVSNIEVIELYRIKDEVKRLTLKITEQFSSIFDFMTRMKVETNCENLVRMINESIAQQQNERTNMRELAHNIRDKGTVLLSFAEDRKFMELNQEQIGIHGEIEDDMIRLKRKMAEAVLTWNAKLQDLYMQQKKSKQSSQKKEKEKDTISINSSVAMETEERDFKSTSSSMAQSAELDMPMNSPMSLSGEDFQPSGPGLHHRRQKSDPPMTAPIRKVTSSSSLDSFTYGVTPGISAVWPKSINGPDINTYVVCHKNEASSMPSSLTGTPDMLEDNKADKHDDGVTDIAALGLTDSNTDKSIETTVEANTVEKLSTPGILPARKSPADDLMEGSTGDKIGALKKTLMNTIWQGSGAFQLVMPFDPCEHYLLPLCPRIPVVVFDHEPSSIISYSLSCNDYHNKLYDIQTSFTQSQKLTRQEQEFQDKSVKEDGSPARKSNAGKLSFFKGGGKDKMEQPDVVKYVPRPDAGPVDSPQDDADFALFTGSTAEPSDKSKSVKQTLNAHIELQFADSTARFYCKIYFAEPFRKLRKLIFPEGEDAFIRSLSRCKPWEAKGGKSGSSFCKTDDDRFILKQMSGMEVESFEKFGPQYFQYISKTEKQQRPTALAKIVGVYRIGFRNQQTNNAMKQDLIVLENLFYNRSISQTFDLKGSERNRLVKTTRKSDEELVLLDENFLRASVDCPLYMLPHSKSMLMMAIGHDSQFLSSNLVMDYSLLVGLDEQRKELVVGIIDYIRTFTWDKKLETILKSNFGGQGKMPTVVSPEVYRTRFLDAMGKYFLSVPDQWSGLGKDVDM